MSRQSEREDSTTLTGTLQVQDQETLGQILHEGELADNSSPGMRTILPSSSAAALPAPLPGAPPGDGNGDTTTGRRKGAAKPKGTKNRRKSAAVETGTEPETGDGDGKGEPVKVTTPLDKAKSARKAILKEGEEARSLAISITGLECSADLMALLEKHAANMTELYKDINAKILVGENEESSYEQIYKTQESFSTWFKARKKIAKSMKSAAESGAK